MHDETVRCCDAGDGWNPRARDGFASGPAGGTSGATGEGAQAARGGSAGAPDMSEWELERLSRALTEARLIGDERSAAEAAVKAKLEARRALFTALRELRGATEDTKATDAGLTQAMAAYQKALTKYRGEVAAQDKALEAKLSVRSQARCLSIGILDNGMGMGGMRSRRGTGGGRRGEGGGRPGEGGGRPGGGGGRGGL
jgi:hypothetical protein